MNVLVLVGSLRADSLNRRLARAAVAELPAGIGVTFAEGLGELPHYDQDLDVAPAPASVAAFRRAVAEADALLVVTPEYNGAPSGVIKNAIDWASRPRGSAAIVGKKVAVLSASGSPRGGQWAREGAVRVLTVAGAEVLPDTVGVGSAHEVLTVDGLIDQEARSAVRGLVNQLIGTEALAA